jgi:alkylation response protein AidB-like acyl-CoA dehydrogenase
LTTSNESKKKQEIFKTVKSLRNVPFIKSLFCGNYVLDYLKYPEYSTNQELNLLNETFVNKIRTFIENDKNEPIVDKNTGNFTRNALDKLTNIQIFSSSLTKEFDGAEIDCMGVAQILENLSFWNISLGISILYNNEIVTKSILVYGNQEQKNKYLKKMSKGELVGGFCFSELGNGQDTSRFTCKSTALGSSGKQTFLLNGKKTWICVLNDNSDIDSTADKLVLLVITKTVSNDEFYEPLEEADINLAKTEHLKRFVSQTNLNAFIVDSNTKGVVIKKQHSNKNGLNLYEVEFNNVEVNQDALLGSMNNGFDIASKIIENSHYLVGAICLGLLKNVLQETVLFTIKSKRFGKSLSDFHSIKDKIANIEAKIYAMESKLFKIIRINLLNA